MSTVRILNVNILSITQDELLNNLYKGVLITPTVDHGGNKQKYGEEHSGRSTLTVLWFRER